MEDSTPAAVPMARTVSEPLPLRQPPALPELVRARTLLEDGTQRFSDRMLQRLLSDEVRSNLPDSDDADVNSSAGDAPQDFCTADGASLSSGSPKSVPSWIFLRTILPESEFGILCNILDGTRLLWNLRAEEYNDPVWMKLGAVHCILPRLMDSYFARSLGLQQLLAHSVRRLRPVQIIAPDKDSVLMAGEEFTVAWKSIPCIGGMLERKSGVKFEEQMVDIGYLLAGTSVFHPNIAACVPFHAGRHVWKVPLDICPGRYWLSIRLSLPLSPLLEGAGPCSGSFVVQSFHQHEEADEWPEWVQAADSAFNSSLSEAEVSACDHTPADPEDVSQDEESMKARLNLNTALDFQQLFQNFEIQDYTESKWLRVDRVRCIVPSEFHSLLSSDSCIRQLFGDYENTSQIRPIQMVAPNVEDILMAGEDFTITWKMLPCICQMIEKHSGVKVEEQMVEIGWLVAGTSSFSPNIAEAVPFHLGQYTWSVPSDFMPGRYWLTARLIPFAALRVEGAAPLSGSFVVQRFDPYVSMATDPGSWKCGICLQEFMPDMEVSLAGICRRRSCTEKFCRDCMGGYVASRVGAGRFAVLPIRCPAPSCKRRIQTIDWAPLCDEEDFDSYVQGARDLLGIRCPSCDETNTMYVEACESTKRNQMKEELLDAMIVRHGLEITGTLKSKWSKFAAGSTGADLFLDCLLNALGLTNEEFINGRQKEVVLRLIPDVERRCTLHLAMLRRHPFIYTPCCREPVCFKCKISGHHAGLTCKEVQERELSVDCQFCPGCGVPTQKTEGCTHMVCLCGTEWTWQGEDLNLVFDD